MRPKNSGKSGAINFSVSNDIKVEVTTQNRKHDANGVSNTNETGGSILHSQGGKDLEADTQ